MEAAGFVKVGSATAQFDFLVPDGLGGAGRRCACPGPPRGNWAAGKVSHTWLLPAAYLMQYPYALGQLLFERQHSVSRIISRGWMDLGCTLGQA